MFIVLKNDIYYYLAYYKLSFSSNFRSSSPSKLMIALRDRSNSFSLVNLFNALPK